MPTVTSPLNLTKPTIGGDKDVWGQYWNDNADKLNAIHTNDGTGTSVGMHVGTGKVLKVDGGTSDVILPGQLDTQSLRLRDGIDASKVVDFKVDKVTTLTTRTLSVPDRSGTIALEEQLTERVAAVMPTGTVLSGYYGATPPAGFVFADGRSIGDASSNATNRANADTKALFTRFWTFGFPLQNQDGSAATVGASATADFDAHKRVLLPDHSGRAAVGRDNLSGTARGILSGYTSVGVAGGVQSTSTTGTGGASVNGSTAAGDIAQAIQVQAGSNSGPFSLYWHGHTMSFNAPVSVSTAAFTIVQPSIAVDVVIAL